MTSLLPKRTIANPATAEERRITKRNADIAYKALEYGSYALGGLGLLKKALALSKYGFKNEPKGKLTKGFGNWFTTDLFEATRKIRQGGSLLKTKVDLKTLQKIKDQQPSHRTHIKRFNSEDRNFFGIVPSSIRRKAERTLVKKVEYDIAGRVKIK